MFSEWKEWEEQAMIMQEQVYEKTFALSVDDFSSLTFTYFRKEKISHKNESCLSWVIM